MKLKNKHVLVYGLGDSGRAVIKILQEEGARVRFYDDNIKYFEYIGFDRHPEQNKYDLVIVSPGIKVVGNELLKKFIENKIQIMSELDFAYLRCKGKIVAITGTNGKTTTSMLVNKILRAAGYKTFLCGNIGLPFSAICKKTTKDSIVVCEVSNFQLETSKFFRSDVACVLNIKPDHLDRHESFEEYVRCKAKIAQNLKSRDVLILNLDDAESKKLILHKKFQFFSKNRLKKGIYCYKNQIFVNKKPIISLNSISLLGDKNLENILAAVAMCSHFNVRQLDFEKSISSFEPASHRMQKIGIVEGVCYVDDSKATNIASVVACVEAFKNEKIILLMGGQGKNIDYAEFFSLGFCLKQVVSFGADGRKIFESAKKIGYNSICFNKFSEAVLYAKEIAEENDFVLLSPACASFDEFSNYAERGERFKSLILGCEDEK